MDDLADIRRNYESQALSKEAAEAEPFDMFKRWLEDAFEADELEATAMVLATVVGSRPRSRTVLLKGLDRGLRFYTNYESAKATELVANPAAAVCFLWPKTHRQVRIEGEVERLEDELSDEYFASRPRGSQLGAWTSPQSQELSSRQELERLGREVERRFGVEGEVPRPPFWGGFRLLPARFEFWQGRPDRLHDRLEYSRESAGSAEYQASKAAWSIRRLAP